MVMPTLEDCRFCIECGVILCEMCFSSNSSNTRHRRECALLVEAGHKFQIRLVKLMAENNVDRSQCPLNRNSEDAQKMNFVLAPLRYLLESEADPSLLDLEDNYANRIDTLLYCVIQVVSFEKY